MNYKLSEIALINPKESLPSGSLAKKVAMEKLQPFCRDIDGFELTKYNGGTKFRNGDTIMARITPCLENGKIAKVNILDEKEIGFGSTEYIIFRAKPGVTDEDYLYYLITSPIVRNPAIKSMVGSSGRQRVQTDVIQNLEIDVPELPIQKKIGSILKRIDDKIELNRKINDNLANQVKSLYEDIINDLDIENLPPGFKLITLSDIAEVQSGKRPNSRTEKSDEINIYPLVGAASIMGFTNNYNFDEKILITGRVGTHGVIQRFSSPCWASDNTLIITSNYYEFTSQVLQHIDYRSMNRGSTQPLITQSDLKKKQIILPDLDTLNRFEKTASSLMTLYDQNLINNKELAELRDSLLPKLMSGEIDVDSIEL